MKKKLIFALAALHIIIVLSNPATDAACCTVHDNGTGTADFPSADCAYITPDDDMRIVSGLQSGTTIEIDATNDDFVCDVNNTVCSFLPGTNCRQAGGSLGGEMACLSSTLHLPMVGTGALSGFNRLIDLQINCETHIGPRTPGDPVQSFDTDMFRLFGQLPPGDPDFDLLRITAGSDFGMPSPGYTTLTRQPDGNWAVDSFFDITYRIDFVGKPGGALSGMSGSTTAMIRIATCPGQDVKWSQPPDKTRNGIAIRIDRYDQTSRIIADDFPCTQTGPITDVHFWGSWKGDPIPHGYIYNIHLSIHKDIPATAANPHSRPGDVLWEKDFGPNEFTETLVADLTPDYEWWWDVYSAAAPAIPEGDHKIYRYEIDINPNDAFVQEGNPSDPQIYWLDIYVLTEFGEFGWKTSSQHWNDDSVYGYDQAGTGTQWMELTYPDNHSYGGRSIDMAFAITTKPIAEPTQGCCFSDGSCADLTEAECIEKNGTPQGAGTNCATTQCPVPEPTQACCLPDGSCAGLTLAECKARGGTPQGAGTNCTPGLQCPVPCDIPPMICPTSGDPAVIITYWGGFNDNFASPPETTSPDAALLSFITTCSAPGVPLKFDQVSGEAGVPANSWLGHTFTGLPFGIVSARLQVRARATTNLGAGGTYNDSISIVSSIAGCTPTYAWSSRFANLPEAGGTWNPGQVGTFCLNLAALPTTAGPVSVLNQLANGSLRIYIQDDSGVDYIKLTVAVCPCKYQSRQEVTVGVNDNCKFSPPPKPASPSTALTTAFPGLWRQFDETVLVVNRRFGHTFTGLPPGIFAAQLEVCLRAVEDFPYDDVFYLQFLNPTFAWGKSIASLTGLPWNFGDQKLLILNLGNLPPSTAGVTSVLGTLASGKLDVIMQDDTAIDYITLRYWTCCAKSMSGDINRDGIVDFLDFAILAEQWLEVDPCPSCP